jgi:predicted  nucleic acid-binding Zn-ribbon protein
MTQQQLETDVAALQAQAATLRTRLTYAQTAKQQAQAAIVDGDAKAGARAAAADQQIVALTAAVADVNGQVSSLQAAIATIQRNQAEAERLELVAEVAQRAEQLRAELDQTFVDGCAVLSDLLDAMADLTAELGRQRSAGLDLLQTIVPDVCAPTAHHAYRPETQRRRDEMLRQVRVVDQAMQQRGTTLAAILTHWEAGKGGRRSDADTLHKFPPAAFDSEVRVLLDKASAEARRHQPALFP